MTQTPEQPEAHPLDAARQEAAQTTWAQVRAVLHAQAQAHAALGAYEGWTAAAEDTLRGAIGMERKAGLEMRSALGEAGAAFIRRTEPLGEMTLPELRHEYAAGRQTTLELLDAIFATPGLTPWVMGEEVEPLVYACALRERLERLAGRVAAAQADPPL